MAELRQENPGKTVELWAEDEARGIVSRWVVGAALTAPIPESSVFLTIGDSVMARQVADCFGIGFFDSSALTATLGSVAAGTVGSVAIGEVVGILPILGWAAKSYLMAMKAELIGEQVIQYFRERSPLIDA